MSYLDPSLKFFLRETLHGLLAKQGNVPFQGNIVGAVFVMTISLVVPDTFSGLEVDHSCAKSALHTEIPGNRM